MGTSQPVWYGENVYEMFLLIMSHANPDGCSAETTSIKSETGRLDLVIQLHWLETNLGEISRIDCPCGSLTTTTLQATRYCNGSFVSGAMWEKPNDGPCDLSDLAREICLLSMVEVCLAVHELNILKVYCFC